MRNELPEKWFIRFNNEEQFKVLNKYFSKGLSRTIYEYTGNDRCFDNKFGYYGSSNMASKYAEEITFEEFKMHILKETPQSTNINKLLTILKFINNHETSFFN